MQSHGGDLHAGVGGEGQGVQSRQVAAGVADDTGDVTIGLRTRSMS